MTEKILEIAQQKIKEEILNLLDKANSAAIIIEDGNLCYVVRFNCCHQDAYYLFDAAKTILAHEAGGEIERKILH
jgi:hypothetical protein